MAVDRIADFVLSGISDRFYMPDLSNQSMRRSTADISTMFDIDFSNNTIEIPAFSFRDTVLLFQRVLDDDYNADINTRFVYSINKTDYITVRKQVNTILKDIILRGYDHRMPLIKNKENIYCGYPGIITDVNFSPLICLKVKINIEGNKLTVIDYICYISPKVFSNQDGIIEKVIYKKIIPFCASHVLSNTSNDLRYRYNDIVKYDWEGKHINVVIKDDFECFFNPNPPRIEDFDTDDVVRNILIDNVNSLL